MGCSQSVLCAATLSQQEPPGQQQGGGLTKQRSGKFPPVRTFDADPGKTAQSAAERLEATEAAEALLSATKGLNYRDTYIRATLVSYGGSCRVFTAVNKHSQEPVAIKTITKVGVTQGGQSPLQAVGLRRTTHALSSAKQTIPLIASTLSTPLHEPP
jgi:hypothetical protein